MKTSNLHKVKIYYIYKKFIKLFEMLFSEEYIFMKKYIFFEKDFKT